MANNPIYTKVMDVKGSYGSGRPKAQLAILPGTTHYEIFMSPKLVAVVNPFLDAVTPN